MLQLGLHMMLQLLGFVLQQGLLWEGAPPAYLEAPAPLSLTSFALSLLLVFRTNTSYGRWNEARVIWGGITNRSRDIVRQVSVQSTLKSLELLDDAHMRV